MKKPLANIKIEQVTWACANQDLMQVRTAVFIKEQQVEPDFEWDELDLSAVHLLALLDNQAIACLRIIDHKKIGRMAVLKPWRVLGIGKALLVKAIEICNQQGSQQIILSAQSHAVGFYTKAGFEVISDEYCDVNIPHVDMQLTIDNKSCLIA